MAELPSPPWAWGGNQEHHTCITSKPLLQFHFTEEQTRAQRNNGTCPGKWQRGYSAKQYGHVCPTSPHLSCILEPVCDCHSGSTMEGRGRWGALTAEPPG